MRTSRSLCWRRRVAINGCCPHFPPNGLIQGNFFGKRPDQVPTNLGGNSAKYGAALIYCYGPIMENVFWYNGSSDTISGGALYGCHEVQSNFFAFNQADYGGVALFGATYVGTPNGADSDWGVVRGNIMYANTAYIEGGASDDMRGRWENNTIYANDAPVGSGMNGDLWYAGKFYNQNNILWANTTGAQIEGVGNDQIRYSAIDSTTNPAGSGDNTNLGRWGTSNPLLPNDPNGPGFITVAFTETSPNWATFLHLDRSGGFTSPMIDNGQPDVNAYDPSVKNSNFSGSNGKSYVFQLDFDGQLSPIDVPGVGTEYYNDPNPLVPLPIPMDIGADEWPTDPVNFSFWWENY